MKLICLLLLFVSTAATSQIDDFFTMFDEWNLTIAVVNGESLSIPVNDEVFPITISFSNDAPNYSTTVCGTASGEMITNNGFELMFTSNVNITDETCNLEANNDFQDAYFQFFSSHLNETINYTTIIVDFAPSLEPQYLILMQADNGDELYFSDIPLLSVDSFDELTTTVYPNPTNDFIRIESKENSILQYNLFSQSGKLSKKGILDTDESIDMSSLSVGNYLLVLSRQDGKKVIKKIIKE